MHIAEQSDWKWQHLVKVDLLTNTSDAEAKLKHNNLFLKLKCEVIKSVVKESKIDICKLAGLCSCGKLRFQP